MWGFRCTGRGEQRRERKASADDDSRRNETSTHRVVELVVIVTEALIGVCFPSDLQIDRTQSFSRLRLCNGHSEFLVR